MRAAILALLALAGIASVWLTLEAADFLHTAPESPGRQEVVVIEPGATFDEVAAMLQRRGLITDADRFRLLGRLFGKVTRVRAGEFRLFTDWGPHKVLGVLTSGRGVLHRLTVREGLTWRETGELVAAAGLGSFDSFAATVADPDFLAAHHIPADTAEGYLFPETYSLPRPQDGDAGEVARTMVEEFRRVAAEIWPQGLPAPDRLHRLVILASLVEKETAAPSERRRIAGVYANRLERGMLLQCDPTVIYGLGTDFDGNLTKAHLRDSSNPYNTYRHRGLPPGPICSPGRAALAAAADPEAHSFLYFVSKKDGTHHFSRNLAEHNRAVRTYQLRR